MATYTVVPRSRAEVDYVPEYKPIAQLRPVQIDEHYFDKLAAFGLACLAAAIVGKLVMASLRRQAKR